MKWIENRKNLNIYKKKSKVWKHNIYKYSDVATWKFGCLAVKIE